VPRHAFGLATSGSGKRRNGSGWPIRIPGFHDAANDAERLATQERQPWTPSPSPCADNSTADSPVLALDLAPEHQRALERLLAELAPETFHTSDGLG